MLFEKLKVARDVDVGRFASLEVKEDLRNWPGQVLRCCDALATVVCELSQEVSEVVVYDGRLDTDRTSGGTLQDRHQLLSQLPRSVKKRMLVHEDLRRWLVCEFATAERARHWVLCEHDVPGVGH